MAHCHAVKLLVGCRTCAGETEADLWAILDPAERPDLVDRLYRDELRWAACQHCGAPLPLPGLPLLVYRPGAFPLLILGCLGNDRQEILDAGGQLLGILRDGLGPAWQDGMLAEVKVLPWEVMAVIVASEDPAAVREAAYELPAEVQAARAAALSPADHREWQIHHLLLATRAVSRQHRPRRWATLQAMLAGAYSDYMDGDWKENIETALGYARAALEVFTEPDENRAKALGSLGNILSGRVAGDPVENQEQAIAAYEEASALFGAADRPYQRAKVGTSLIRVYVDRMAGSLRRNIAAAIRHGEEAVEAFLSCGAHEAAAGALMSLGNVHAGSGDQERALETYERVLGLLQAEPRSAYWAHTHMNAGNACRDMHRLGQAVDHYSLALTGCSRDRTPVPWAKVQENWAWALLNLGSSGDLEQAQRRMAAAADTYARAGEVPDQLRALNGVGLAAGRQRDWAGAVRAFEQATQVHESLLAEAYTEAGRRAVIGDFPRMHTQFAYALACLGRYDEALVRLEQGKSRLMREAEIGAGNDLNLLPEADAAAVRRLWAEIAELAARPADGRVVSELSVRREQLQRLLARLRSNHSQAFPTPPSLADILTLAPPGGTLLVPLVTEFGGLAFNIRSGTRTVGHRDVVPLPGLTTDRLQAFLASWALALPGNDGEALEGVLGAVSNSIPVHFVAADLDGLCRLLWDNVMGPVDRQIGCLARPVTILPHGGIGLLPLHAAMAPDGRRFLDRRTVRYVPSASLASGSRTAVTGGARSLFALADPTGQLPYSEAESHLAASYVAPDARTVVVGPDAGSRSLRQAAGASHLHIACHARYDWAFAAGAELSLAGGELVDLAQVLPGPSTLPPFLVALSCCDTGISEIRRMADEYLGIPAALHRAGVPLVLSTLWPVDDSVTALLVGRFYRNHLRDGAEPATALRDAQDWMRRANTEDLTDWVDEIVDRLPPPPAGEVARPRLAMELLREELEEDWQPGDRPYQDTRHWAAFTLSGHLDDGT